MRSIFRPGHKAIRAGVSRLPSSLLVTSETSVGYWRTPEPICQPWNDPKSAFFPIIKEAQKHSIVSPDRMLVLLTIASRCQQLGGHFAECGVYRGGTAIAVGTILGSNPNVHLRLFDSFEGLPEVRAEDTIFEKGMFADNDVTGITQRVAATGVKVHVHKGWIPDTFVEVPPDEKFSFVHLDVDIYQSTIDALGFFWDRLVPGGCILFDEYNFPGAGGERLAADNFFSERQLLVLPLPTGQGVIWKG